ncbi:hypothetical protein EG68_12112 [Paragonimus skrjabini miyazakii]|uniref:adenylate cyclase n=1 Tax=Paragonimus skrjabini miyazakii TaxID=59628 RepID=A0A8S9YFR7_9TREM|nr:hypothetical protein EG68_12112 [Paragonimus skrjabini miyazakii]
MHQKLLSAGCRVLKETTSYMSIQMILCSVVVTAGMHLQFWNTVRRRAAFIYIGQSVHLQRRNRKAQNTQDSLLRVLLPVSIWHKFWGRDQPRQTYGKRYLYLQPTTKLTFLAAELVNFHELSAQHDINQLLQILSDMIDYFDSKAEEHSCERLCVQPDMCIYTCGVVKTRMNHATACVNFALDMIRVNQHLTVEGNTLILLKIGIHTGVATVVVWGCKKVHYDVLTPDLSIVFQVKNVCPPGCITISDTTHTRVHMHYSVEHSQRLVLQTEREVDGALTIETILLPTYRIQQDQLSSDNLSSTVIEKSGLGLFGHCLQLLEQIRVSRNRQPTLINQDFASDSFPIAATVGRKSVFNITPRPSEPFLERMEIAPSQWTIDKSIQIDSSKPYQLDAEILRLVTELRSDPKRQITLMQYLPVGHWTNVFLNKELEWHYVNHVRDPTYPIYIDSLKIAPALDVLITLFTAVITIICSLMFTTSSPSGGRFHLIYGLELSIAFMITISVFWTSTRFPASISSPSLRRLYDVLSRSSVQRIFIFLITLFPTLHTAVFFVRFKPTKQHVESFRVIFVCFQMIGMVNHMTATTSPQWLSILGLLVSTFTFIGIQHRIMALTADRDLIMEPSWALRQMETHISECIIDTCVTVVMVCVMINLNDRNCRLNFICMRELQICREESELFHTKMQEMMGYLLPNYVVKKLIVANTPSVHATLAAHNVTLDNVGVAVLYLSNLYKTHWNVEPEKCDLSLKVLNLIICTIDELLASDTFDQLERVHFFSDQMLVVSGMDQSKNWDPTDTDHINELVDFCFEVKRKLGIINRQHLPKHSTFTLNIGYTRGHVTTGIFGSAKPTFAVWGKHVRLAESIAKAGHPNEVQTTSTCIKLLSTKYEVIFSGVLAVEESGLVETYIVRSLRSQ